jgi:hydrogenase nickel incorporation protein HypB
MFSICHVLLINKIDVMNVFDFDLERCISRVRKINPTIKIIPISARTGEGLDEFAEWLRHEVKTWKE